MSAIEDLMKNLGVQSPVTAPTGTTPLQIPWGANAQNFNAVSTNSGTQNTTDLIAQFYTWTPKQYQSFVAKLRSQGYIGKSAVVTVTDISTIWVNAVNEASKFLNSTSGAVKMTPEKLLETYAPGVQATTTTGANIPTRQIYQYKKEDIYKLIDDVYQSTLGRFATEQEKAARYAPLEKQINQGTVSTTAQVKNPKTGKMENVVTQTPAFSAQAAQTSIEAELKKANPDDFDRKKRIDFASWISQNAQGA